MLFKNELKNGTFATQQRQQEEESSKDGGGPSDDGSSSDDENAGSVNSTGSQDKDAESQNSQDNGAGSEDKEAGSEDKEAGSEDEKTGSPGSVMSPDVDAGSKDNVEPQDKEAGSEDEKTGSEDDEGSQDKMGSQDKVSESDNNGGSGPETDDPSENTTDGSSNATTPQSTQGTEPVPPIGGEDVPLSVTEETTSDAAPSDINPTPSIYDDDETINESLSENDPVLSTSEANSTVPYEVPYTDYEPDGNNVGVVNNVGESPEDNEHTEADEKVVVLQRKLYTPGIIN